MHPTYSTLSLMCMKPKLPIPSPGNFPSDDIHTWKCWSNKIPGRGCGETWQEKKNPGLFEDCHPLYKSEHWKKLFNQTGGKI